MSTTTRPGVGDCPRCDARVLFAFDGTGALVALNPAPQGGPVAVAWDADWTPHCRPVPPGSQLVLGEHLFAPHPEDCGALAPVIPLTSSRPRRQPVTGGRRASAR